MPGGVQRRERFTQGHEQSGLVQHDGLIQRLAEHQRAELAVAGVASISWKTTLPTWG